MILRQGNLATGNAMEESLTLVEDTFEVGHSLNMQPSDFYLVTHDGLNFITKPAQHFRVTDKKKAVCDHLLTLKDFGADDFYSVSWRPSGSFSWQKLWNKPDARIWDKNEGGYQHSQRPG